MPSLKGVLVHDALGNVAWASEDWDLGDEPDVVKEAIAGAITDPHEFPGVVRHDADSAVYSFALRGEHVDSLGVVSLLVRLSGARRTEARPLSYIRQLVQPALECLRRELALRSKLGSRERDLDVRERDLSLMLEMSSTQSATGEADEFDLILKTAMEHMDCALVALWVPDKNIGLSMTRSGNPMSPESLLRAQQHLMAWMQLQQRTIVVNHISKVASDVAAPVQDPGMPGAPPLRAGDGRDGAVQSRERSRFRFPSNPRCRAAGEKSDRHHPGSIRCRHRSHDPPCIRAPGQVAALGGDRVGHALHSLSGHRPPARHQRNLRHARGG